MVKPMPRRIILFRPFALAWLALILLVGSAPAQDITDESAGQRVTDKAEIDGLLKDQTVYGRYVNGLAWSEYHSPDGRTAYHENDCTYAGHWWIADGLVCFRYDAFNQGRPACFRLYRQGDRLNFYYPSLVGPWVLNAYSIGRRPGNPDKMPVEGQVCVGV